MLKKITSFVMCAVILFSTVGCKKAKLPEELENAWFTKLEVGDMISPYGEDIAYTDLPESYFNVDRNICLIKEENIYVVLTMRTIATGEPRQLLGLIAFNEQREMVYSMGIEAVKVKENNWGKYLGRKLTDIKKEVGDVHASFIGGGDHCAYITTTGYIVVFCLGSGGIMNQIVYYDIINRTQEVIDENQRDKYIWSDEEEKFVVENK